MTRILFVDRAGGTRGELAQALYEQRGGEARTAAAADDAWPEVVVDVDAWNLADPVGACRAELDELRVQIARRVADLPL
jgi:hypothetical protein